MKNYLFILGLLFSTLLLSQQKEKFTITGTIKKDSINIKDTHVINKNSLKGTISDKVGNFNLIVKTGDTLFISHLNFEKKEIIINTKHKESKKIMIELSYKTHVLNEVSIKKRQSIFYISPEIIPKNKINKTVLKLPYANIITKNNTKITHATFTSFSVDIENFINALNGKTKKNKELREIKLKDKKLNKIRAEFTDYFFVNQLNIRKQYINQFLNYCLNSGILKTQNKLTLTEIMLKESRTFTYTKINEKTLLTKQ